MIEVKEIKEDNTITHDNIVIALQAMDNACIRTNGQQFIESAKYIEESVDYLIEQNKMLMERIKRIEEIRWANS